jgi:hypothetical protein
MKMGDYTTTTTTTNNNNIKIIYFAANVLSPGGSGYYSCTQI